jgi:CDP-6-deoxy-D-xylo-4-hexulose-3-dehydrase
MYIPLMKSTFLSEQETKDTLCSFIQKSEKLSMGDEVFKFEESFASWQGRSHSVMVNSGSSANLVVLQALMNLGRLSKGDRVGVSAVTWATNVMPVIQLGLVPILIDVNLETLNISSEEVRKHDIRCLFITHLLGFHGDIEEIAEYCKSKDILLLEDTCESLGTICNGKKLGNFGLASTFSTFVGHHMSTIEGGLIATDDDELNKMIRMVRAHGWDRNVTQEQRSELRSKWDINDFYGPYTFYTLGYNVRPMDLQGLIGSIQLKHVDASNENRCRSFARVYDAIDSKDLMIPNQYVPAFAIPIICSTKEIRDSYVKKCKEMGIETRPIVAGNMNRQPFFKEYMNETPLPVADKIHTCGFYLPNHPDLTEEEIDYLTSVFTDASDTSRT